jgi:flagellar basal body-associated protein FliL
MTILIILAIVAIIMAIALVGTLLITKERDADYNSGKSINNQVWMYVALIPILIIVGLIFWL